MAVLLLVLVIALWIWGANQRGQVKQLRRRLDPIEDADRYTKLARQSADSDIANARGEADQIVAAAKLQNSQLEQRIGVLKAAANSAKQELDLIEEGLRLKADDAHLMEVGYYEPIYGFEDLQKYQSEIKRIKEQQRAMLRLAGEKGDFGAAAFTTQSITYNGSEIEGRKLIKKVLQLMLRAFNGECDAFIARVTYRNVTTMQKRIQSSFDQINKLGSTWSCELGAGYLASRLAELNLVYEYAEFEQKVKEEQAWLLEQDREKQKADREAEKYKRDTERRARDAAEREASVEQAVRQKQQEMAVAAETEKDAFRQQIEDLQRRLAEAQEERTEAEEERKRAISLAEQTRAGHVYIFSNVGSFGPNVYKK